MLVVTIVTACSRYAEEHADASATIVKLACESGGTTFPGLDKACSYATDCFIARHMINCCGTQIAVGVNAADESSFAAAESACAAAYAACGCAEQPTMAEDGRTENQGAIAVRCDSGRCRTYVP